MLANKCVPCRSASLASCLVYLHSTVTSGTCISRKGEVQTHFQSVVRSSAFRSLYIILILYNQPCNFLLHLISFCWLDPLHRQGSGTCIPFPWSLKCDCHFDSSPDSSLPLSSGAGKRSAGQGPRGLWGRDCMLASCASSSQALVFFFS